MRDTSIFDDLMKFRQILIFLVKLFMLLVRDMSVNVTLNIYMCFHIMFVLHNK